MKCPIEAFELAGLGGTNFARVELARGTVEQQELFSPLALLGHSADEMIEVVNALVREGNPLGCRQIIISGGIRSFLDGYYYISKSLLPSIFGQAASFLRFARGDYDDLRSFVNDQIRGLAFARSFLQVKS
jgi:isopentenyl-diphosphate delta-isomerase